MTFYRPRTNTREIMDNDVFIIDPASGILQTNRTLGQFADGYFNLVFRASNGPGDKKRGDFTTLKVPCSYIYLLIFSQKIANEYVTLSPAEPFIWAM